MDENLKAIEGTEKYIDCDLQVLSVGLIPENELSENKARGAARYVKEGVGDYDSINVLPGKNVALYCLSEELFRFPDHRR